jgi:hypothetical protein
MLYCKKFQALQQRKLAEKAKVDKLKNRNKEKADEKNRKRKLDER